MRIHLYLLCIFTVIIIFSACQKEFENPFISVIPPASSLDKFRVNADGFSFPTYVISTINVSNEISITASDVLAIKRVAVTVPANTIPGSYTLDFSGMIYFGIYYPDTSNMLISNPGAITIVENNVSSKRIRGTFSFTAKPLNGSAITSVLTNGYFSVKYP